MSFLDRAMAQPARLDLSFRLLTWFRYFSCFVPSVIETARAKVRCAEVVELSHVQIKVTSSKSCEFKKNYASSFSFLFLKENGNG